MSAAWCRCTPIAARKIKEVLAGDIAAAIGLKDVTTGDTLCSATKPVVLERMEFPEPVISVAVEPRSQADQEKLGVLRWASWLRKILPSVLKPMKKQDKPLSLGWVSCI